MSTIKRFTGHYINGKHHIDNGKKIDIFNPSTGELLAILSSASNQTIEKVKIERDYFQATPIHLLLVQMFPLHQSQPYQQ